MNKSHNIFEIGIEVNKNIRDTILSQLSNNPYLPNIKDLIKRLDEANEVIESYNKGELLCAKYKRLAF